jgi:hypothetical protein
MFRGFSGCHFPVPCESTQVESGMIMATDKLSGMIMAIAAEQEG